MNKTDSAQVKWSRYYDKLATEARRLIDEYSGRDEFLSECPFCKSVVTGPLFGKHGFQYTRCSDCGLIWLNPLPDHETLERLYNNPEIREFFFREILLAFGEQGQVGVFSERLRKIQRLIGDKPASPRLLDIGCAAGNFIALARENKFDCVGLELHQGYIDYARQTRGLDVRKQTVAKLAQDSERFDVVTMWDVLEHVQDPFTLLKEVNQIVSPGGVFAFSTINHRCLNAILLKKDWRYYLPPDHLYSFTPNLLTKMLEASGFSVAYMHHQYVWDVLAEGAKNKKLPFLDPNWILYYTVPQLGAKPGLLPRLVKYGLIISMRFLLIPISLMEKLLNYLHLGDIVTVYVIKEVEPGESRPG